MIAMHYVNDADAAEDIVQEFFIDFWEKRRDTPLKNSFEAYAVRAVKNQSISRIRSQNTQDKRLNQFGNETYTEIDDETSNFDKEALQLEVLRLIEQLPPERKKILLMSAKDGLSNKEIAEKLELSINTVKSQIVKAYAFIRENAKSTKISQDGRNANLFISHTAILIALLSVS